MNRLMACGLAAALSIFLGGAAQAQIKVGFITSLSGPGASIGIPYSKGLKAGLAHASSVAGEKIKVIELDDASDTSAAARNARKLVDEEKVDVLIGTSGVPGSLAMIQVVDEEKTPMIGLTPLPPAKPVAGGPWVISIPQPPKLMVDAVVDHMKAKGIKTVAYIGFSDSWGELVYNCLMAAAKRTGIKVVTNERYARPDTSVTGQVLKIIAAHPDAVMDGGSGTPGALPLLTLREHGYNGPIYGSHALINADFIRVGGKAAEGIICPTGPVVVAEQLPDSAPTKKAAMEFRAAYKKANGVSTTDAFSPYAYDAWLVFLDSAKRALAKAKPGTPAFRDALREAMVNTKNVVGAHAVYNFTPASLNGVDARARVIVRLEKGKWKLMPE
jgi:branched-chain amino acid transport system substrate-binding protein